MYAPKDVMTFLMTFVTPSSTRMIGGKEELGRRKTELTNAGHVSDLEAKNHPQVWREASIRQILTCLCCICVLVTQGIETKAGLGGSVSLTLHNPPGLSDATYTIRLDGAESATVKFTLGIGVGGSNSPEGWSGYGGWTKLSTPGGSLQTGVDNPGGTNAVDFTIGVSSEFTVRHELLVSGTIFTGAEGSWHANANAFSSFQVESLTPGVTADVVSLLGNFPYETKQGRFGTEYQIGFEEDELRVKLDICLTGDDPGEALRNTWETGIESIWNDQYQVSDGDFRYPIVFDVEFVDTDGGVNVNVVEGDGRPNMKTWYTGDPANWGHDYQDELAAHEFGHMISLYDEYDEKDGAVVDPDNPITDYTSIMGSLDGTPKERHYEHILDWLEDKSGRTMVLGQSPMYAPGETGSPVGDGSPSPGDTNNDGLTDDIDYQHFVEQFGGSPALNSADFDGDGTVDLEDFVILRASFWNGNRSGPLGPVMSA